LSVDTPGNDGQQRTLDGCERAGIAHNLRRVDVQTRTLGACQVALYGFSRPAIVVAGLHDCETFEDDVHIVCGRRGDWDRAGPGRDGRSAGSAAVLQP
jgi:hypothetical protein